MKTAFFRMISFFLIIIIFTAAISGCGKKDDSQKSDKLSVAVTILPEQAWVKAICGDLVDIITIVPPGSSPENYEPTAQQIEVFTDADVFFKIGVPCEESKMFPEAGKAVPVNLNEKAADVYEDLKFTDNSRDPHIWLSVKRAVVMVKAMTEKIAELDPKNKETYNKNASAYIKELEDTSAYIKGLFKNLTEHKRTFLTFHPAYGYFAAEFGLKMYSLEEEGKEATAQDLQNMIDFAKENRIKVMFIQAESSSSQPDAFVEEVGGRTVVLNPLSGDYISNMKYMAEQIAGALQ